ncbi:MAG: extensin family protein [Lentilitoribacter sp.]
MSRSYYWRKPYYTVRMIGKVIISVFSTIFSLGIAGGAVIVFLVFWEETPLPNAWNPKTSLKVQDPITLVTGFKFSRALRDGATCAVALKSAGNFVELPTKTDGQLCGIKDHVLLSGIGGTRVKPVNTRCQTALRVAMWTEHVIQPAAQRNLNTLVTETHHLSSYNCREIRTTGNNSAKRMSTHATAEAIDIQGFSFANGARTTLLEHWGDGSTKSKFLKEVRDGACDWFRVTLSPEYNSLHADHFHLQHTGWGLCR